MWVPLPPSHERARFSTLPVWYPYDVPTSDLAFRRETASQSYHPMCVPLLLPHCVLPSRVHTLQCLPKRYFFSYVDGELPDAGHDLATLLTLLNRTVPNTRVRDRGAAPLIPVTPSMLYGSKYATGSAAGNSARLIHDWVASMRVCPRRNYGCSMSWNRDDTTQTVDLPTALCLSSFTAILSFGLTLWGVFRGSP